MRTDRIIAVAERLRAEMAPALSPLEALPIAPIAKRLRISSIGGPLTVMARGHRGLDDDTYAVSAIDLASETAWIWLHRDAWRELAREVPRTRFTVAHELIHCAGHADELDALCVKAEPDHHERLESEANFGAGHLLIPTQGLRWIAQNNVGLHASAIARRYGVSIRAAELRLRDFSEER